MTGPSDLLTAINRTYPTQSNLLSTDVLVLDFGNSVGLVDMPGLGRWCLQSGKWGEEAFEWMLHDLMEVASALPFAAARPTALPYDRSVVAEDDLLYHAFVYLRHTLLRQHGGPEDLLRSLNLVLNDPHQSLQRTRESVPIELAGWVDSSTLSHIASGAEPLVKVRESLAALPPAARLNRFVPERVYQPRTLATYDTPENRFIKTFLGLASGVAERMARVARQAPGAAPFRAQLLNDCEAICRALEPIRRHPLWRSVGLMVHLPAGSTVLQRRRGYKDVFGHFARLRLAARVPLDAAIVRDLLEVRDIAQLYELWCFFALARVLETVIGSPPTRAGRPQRTHTEIIVPWDFDIEWQGRAHLYYNRSFHHSVTTRYSYSVPLRPDITLECSTPTGVALHLFDAKFKLESLNLVMPVGDDGPDGALASEERRGTFTRGDLYKMHTYRDAIKDASSVWVLYPGTEARFYSEDGGRWLVSTDALPRLNGVGAIPLQPNGETMCLGAVLQTMLGLDPVADSGT